MMELVFDLIEVVWLMGVLDLPISKQVVLHFMIFQLDCSMLDHRRLSG